MSIKPKNIIRLGLLLTGFAIIVTIMVKWILPFMRIDSCLDQGGRWNYDLKKCEGLYAIYKNRIADYYYVSDFDTTLNCEYLKRGKMLDSMAKSVEELITILNMRQSKCKIQYVGITGDTLKIKILDDEYLTEQMGTDGADCYMAETIYTLTENYLFHFVRFQMDYGSHASPGVYSRKDYERMIQN